MKEIENICFIIIFNQIFKKCKILSSHHHLPSHLLFKTPLEPDIVDVLCVHQFPLVVCVHQHYVICFVYSILGSRKNGVVGSV